MTCPAHLDSGFGGVYCTRIDGHEGPHVTSMGADYLALGIVSDVWTSDPHERWLPHEPEHRAAVAAAKAEQATSPPLEEIR